MRGLQGEIENASAHVHSQWEWSEEKPCGCLPGGKGSLAQGWEVRQENILQGEARGRTLELLVS